jgi:hypothetical protein
LGNIAKIISGKQLNQQDRLFLVFGDCWNQHIDLNITRAVIVSYSMGKILILYSRTCRVRSLVWLFWESTCRI